MSFPADSSRAEAGKHSNETMLTTKDVSQWLNVPIRTICLWAECGEIPAVKVGRHWRFYRDEVRCWLEATKKSVNSG